MIKAFLISMCNWMNLLVYLEHRALPSWVQCLDPWHRLRSTWCWWPCASTTLWSALPPWHGPAGDVLQVCPDTRCSWASPHVTGLTMWRWRRWRIDDCWGWRLPLLGGIVGSSIMFRSMIEKLLREVVWRLYFGYFGRCWRVASMASRLQGLMLVNNVRTCPKFRDAQQDVQVVTTLHVAMWIRSTRV